MYELSKNYANFDIQYHRASQESFDFMGIEGQYVPHSGSVLWIERGQDDLSVIWYIFDGIIYIALCDSDFNILEGPF